MAEEPVHEAYSFVCLNCGHGWEREYEIRHFTDPAGSVHVTYHVAGVRVPSPLTHNGCDRCGGQRVRILRPGRVTSARLWPGEAE